MDLILRPSQGKPDRPWALQLREHASLGPTEYHTICYVSDEIAYAIADAGAPFFLFGDPRKKP